MKTVELNVDGRQVQGQVAFAKGVLWMHVDGETFTFEQEKRTRRGGRAGGGAKQAGEVAAPMPGKIVKIHVKAGDKVQNHQVLLVMEAMKMEYTLKAQADGEVAEIRCQPGDQVALGQVLAKLKTAQES